MSLHSNTSKVLEQILYDKLIGHVTSRITPAQFGITHHYSNFFYSSLLNQEFPKVVFLDHYYLLYT